MGSLHEKAKRALPSDALPPRRYWVGVQHYDVPAAGELQESDFLWFKANAKTTFARIRDIYCDRYPKPAVNLKLDGQQVVGSSVVLKDINHYGDNVVVFQAVNATDEATIPHPQPTTDAAVDLTTTLGLQPTTDTLRSALQPAVADDQFQTPKQQTPAADTCTIEPTMGDAIPYSLPGSTPLASMEDVQPSVTPPSSVSHSSAPVGSMFHKPASVYKENLPAGLQEYSQTTTMITPHSEPTSKAETCTPLMAFDPDDVFAKEPAPDLEGTEELSVHDESLRRLLDQSAVELLEAGVGKALMVLDELKILFSEYAPSSPDAAAWLESINKLEQQADRQRTVVGVVGNTGAGKSSVINALLDEERLVPTNCMRACTAVVTEMSWNYRNGPNEKYRAEIEFITPEDWQKELQTLMEEFISDNGTLSRDASDPNSDAGIAWAKFKAVYPKKTKEMLPKSTVAELMAEPAVSAVLGTTKEIKKPGPEEFYMQLQRYVDSKEKSSGKDKDKKKSQQQQPFLMEYWPLIKVVKIYTKSPALSTGAVIVDLPGVHDSNAARAAVAEGYVKQCTGLWIVAPITRAVDDKAAKTLLGESFKRQLKYDGGLSAVTFICSKTDDISITEAMESLQLEEDLHEKDEQAESCKHKIEDLSKRINGFKELKADYKTAMDSAEMDLDIWEGLKDQFDEGTTVYPPAKKKAIRKRKRAGQMSSRKRARGVVPDDDAFVSSDSSSEGASYSEDEDDSSREQPGRMPRVALTESQIKSKVDELKETKKQCRHERTKLENQIQEAKESVVHLKANLAAIRGEMNRQCIAGRNEYSKGAIQQDFAAGIKEMDQDAAEEEDGDNFDPDKDIRDYEEVAKSLPVFCVSSRAYQKLCGRLKKDPAVPGFTMLDETEIPQLQAHCKKLTEAGRKLTCRTFLLSFNQTIGSFRMWSSDDGSGVKLSGAEKEEEIVYLEKRFKELTLGLEGAVRSCVIQMKDHLRQLIFDQYPTVIGEATNAAPNAVQKWTGPRTEGGLTYMTFKAVVRRDGVYSSMAAGPQDFNGDLAQPVMKRLANGWECAFQSRLPKALDEYTVNSSKVLHNFHTTVASHAHDKGASLASIQLLSGNLGTHEQLLKQLGAVLLTSMNDLQRQANREFTPVIIHMMETVYSTCTADSGPGVFRRMKAAMSDYVHQYRHQMFYESTKVVRDHLIRMCSTLEESMATRADDIIKMMKRDYMSVLGGARLESGTTAMSNLERHLRADVRDSLQGIDQIFSRLVDGETNLEHKITEEEVRSDANDEDSVLGPKEDDNGTSTYLDRSPLKILHSACRSGPYQTAASESDVEMEDVNDKRTELYPSDSE